MRFIDKETLIDVISKETGEDNTRKKLKCGTKTFRKLCTKYNIIPTYKLPDKQTTICPCCNKEFESKNTTTCGFKCSVIYFKRSKSKDERLRISESHKKHYNKPPRIKKCKYCGSENCESVECKKFKLVKTLIRYFGFNANDIGTEKYIKEYNRVVSLIKDEYYVNKLSLPELGKKYGFNHNNIGVLFLRNIGINLRDLSNSRKNRIAIYGLENIKGVKAKHGHFIDFRGVDHFYRSSYELEYYKILDKNRTVFQTEKLRIKYFDCIKNEFRTAIPDIYIPADNLIIEIKGIYYYDKENMKDKVCEYIKLGYKFKLILDKKEVDIDNT